MNRIYSILLLTLFFQSALFAQSKEKKTDPDSTGVVDSSLLPTTMPLLLFDDSKEKEEKKEKKKKARKNIWFGIKTQKGFIRNNIRGQQIYEFFNYTDLERKLDPYIRDVYWFDPKDRGIKKEGFAKGKGYLLHGPYERRVNDVVVESGMYYYGTKHKTWMLFDSKNVLQDKDHFTEGWPRESKITYYNRSTQTVEEITPIQYGLEEGNYFYFYEDRQIAVTGEFQYGEKVGLWTEYWDTNNSKTIRKREIQYPETPFADNFKPYIRAEWDKDGNLVYRNPRAINN